MEDVPQPASSPYEEGDRVMVYVGENDLDAEHHGTIARVSEVHQDDYGRETGRETDSFSYTLEALDSGEELGVVFRHFDLVPVSR